MRTNSFSKTFLSLSLLWFCASGVSAQIVQKFGDNSNTINGKAVLEIESTTKGFLLPRMTKFQRDLITDPPEGLMLWCTDCSLGNSSEIVVWVKDSWTGLLISNLGNNSLLLGNANGKATAVTFSGDVTIDNAGVSAIGTSKVLSSMILDGTLIAADIADNAVITSKILDANITNDKLDKTHIPLSGFGAAIAAIELGDHKLTGLAEPTDSDDAATKGYVDKGIGGMNTLADGKVYLGNSGNVATEVTLSGDVTIDNAGVSAIGTSKVLSSMIVDGTLIAADIADNAVITSKILDANVTNAKLDKTNIPLSGLE
jgi:Tfp pilus assembly protein PilV